MSAIKIGLVGQRALNYLIALRDLPSVEVIALCDVNEDLLNKNAEAYGIPNRYRIFEDLCASDVDAVLIGTPAYLHMQQTVTALSAGKHVLCEVLAGTSMEELFWLKEAVERSNKVYMMCENFCYRQDVVLINELINKGFFGDLYFAHVEFMQYMRKTCADNWRRYWFLGFQGPFYPTHSIGPAMKWLKGDRITEVSCYGAGKHYEQFYRQESITTTVLRTEKNRLITLRHDVMSPRPMQCTSYYLQGTRGVVEIGRGTPHTKEQDRIFFKDQPVNLLEDDWEDLWTYRQHLPEKYINMSPVAADMAKNGLFNCYGGDYFMIEDFIAAVNGEKPSPVNVYEACEWSAVALLAEISLQNNSRSIQMPNFCDTYQKLETKI